MQRILVSGFILESLCAAVLVAGCEKSGVTTDAANHLGPAPEKPAAQASTFVYECTDGSTFVTRIEERTAWLFLPTGTVSLPHAPSGSGAKYTDGEITFWTKGEEATMEAEEGARRNCRNNRARAIWEDAKFRGVDFRALGNEPGWNLEISAGGGILYLGDYGQTEYRFPTPEPVEDQDARRTTYTVEDGGHALAIMLEGRVCMDTMSGEAFETRVTVVLDGREHRGCGRALH